MRCHPTGSFKPCRARALSPLLTIVMLNHTFANKSKWYACRLAGWLYAKNTRKQCGDNLYLGPKSSLCAIIDDGEVFQLSALPVE